MSGAKRQSRLAAATLAFLSIASLAGCGLGLTDGEDVSKRGQIGAVKGFLGAVVADEPSAALVGRDALSAGGTAADAAVATYFMMSVTMPSVAGIGGGGVCVAYNSRTNALESLDFLPRPTAGGNMSVPGNVRGMALLHSRFGRLRWEQLVSPAEVKARLGIQISRALSMEYGTPEELARVDPNTSFTYVSAAGLPLSEGTMMKQFDLGSTLGRIRNNGAGDFYVGQLARQLVEATKAAGGDLTMADLRDYLPITQPAMQMPLGVHSLALPQPPNAAGGMMMADIYAILTEARFQRSNPQDRPHILAEAIRRAYIGDARRRAGEPSQVGSAARAKMLLTGYTADTAADGAPLSLPEDIGPPAASFAVMDRLGNSVGCAFSMLGHFGSGKMANGLGVVLAPPPPPGGVVSLAPALVVNTFTKKTFAAVGATGGRAAPGAALQVLMSTFVEDFALEDAQLRPRLQDEGGTVALESDAADTNEALRLYEHKVQLVDKKIGRVNIVYCSKGVPEGPETCAQRQDPRGAGLAAIGN